MNSRFLCAKQAFYQLKLYPLFCKNMNKLSHRSLKHSPKCDFRGEPGRVILPLGDPKYRITGDGPVIRMTGLNVEMKGRNIKAER